MRVEIKNSPIHGMGVFTLEDIEVDEWDNVYGMVVPAPSVYGFEHEGAWYEPFPPWRYTNHSDDPNCVIHMDDDGIMDVMAIKDIDAGEELTIDYGFDLEEDYDDTSA